MKQAIVVDANDIKLILAKHFNVKPENVIKSQYSYTIVTEEEKPEQFIEFICLSDKIDGQY